MKIGVYGGTFNPPHLGHITAARAVMELLKLDRLLLVPAGLPPHKALPAGSPTPEQRLEMTRLAGEQLALGDQVRTLDIEVYRQGKSFTSDTPFRPGTNRKRSSPWPALPLSAARRRTPRSCSPFSGTIFTGPILRRGSSH